MNIGLLGLLATGEKKIHRVVKEAIPAASGRNYRLEIFAEAVADRLELGYQSPAR
jgi:hypothetical protein